MPIPIIIAAVGLGLSVYQTVKADQDKKKAEQELDDYERQKLKNPYLKMSKYPTEALEMRREAAELELSTMANIASKAGRGLAIAGRAGDQYDKRIRQISADQEKYEYQRDQMIAQGELGVQKMQEDRENMDIAGWANLYGAADQNKNNAMISMGNSAAYGAEQAYSIYGGNHGTTSINSPNSTGVYEGIQVGSNQSASTDIVTTPTQYQ